MTPINASAAVSTADDFRSLERARLRALVEREMDLARALHSPDFHLVNPRGITRSREAYLGAVEAGVLTYLKWEAADMMVRQFADVVLLRYQAQLEMPSEDGTFASFFCWHTDSYELHDGLWQVVWSQATRIA